MPLAFPSVGITEHQMRLKRAVAVSESPFSYNTQTYVHQGARWECEVTLPPLTYAEARSVEAFIIGLKGQSGTFTFGHPLHTSTRATLGNTNADAVYYAQKQISLARALASAVDAGTYLQLGDYLYITTDQIRPQGGRLDRHSSRH